MTSLPADVLIDIPQRTIVMLDFDDTICPTSFLQLLRYFEVIPKSAQSAQSTGTTHSNASLVAKQQPDCTADTKTTVGDGFQFRTVPPEHHSLFDRIESAIEGFLLAVMERGEVHLVTNADPVWVRGVMHQFFPRSHTLLSQIPLHAARVPFTKSKIQLPMNSIWKYETFTRVLDEAGTREQIDRIVAVGDTRNDTEAIVCAATICAPQAELVVVQWQQQPSIEQFVYQLQNATEHVDLLFKTYKSGLYSSQTVKVDAATATAPQTNCQGPLSL